jgi:hypothetical protein
VPVAQGPQILKDAVPLAGTVVRRTLVSHDRYRVPGRTGFVNMKMNVIFRLERESQQLA